MQQVIWRIPLPFEQFPAGMPLYGFGLMLFIAFLSGTWLANQRGKARGIDPEVISDMTIYLFIGGIVGARLLFLSELKPMALTDYFFEFFKIWQGGIILYGALGGGLLALVLFWFIVCRPKKLNPLVLADVAAPSLALGIALGRLGCLLNGCCFGMVVPPECPCPGIHFPYPSPPRAQLVGTGVQSAMGFTWKQGDADAPAQVGRVDLDSPAQSAGLLSGDEIVKIGAKSVETVEDAEMALGPMGWMEGQNEVAITVVRDGKETVDLRFVPRTVGLVPAQIYETISMILLLFVLLSAEGYILSRPGQTITLFMMGYSLHRALNELLRNDPRPVGLERNTSLLMFAAGLVLFVLFSLVKKKGLPASTADNPAKTD